jgi:Tfp pilus assembly protein PilF
VALAAHARLDDAAAALRRAIAAEPYYCRPYLYLARLLEVQGKNAEAAEQYRAYVARAPQGGDGVENAREKASALASSGAK